MFSCNFQYYYFAYLCAAAIFDVNVICHWDGPLSERWKHLSPIKLLNLNGMVSLGRQNSNSLAGRVKYN